MPVRYLLGLSQGTAIPCPSPDRPLTQGMSAQGMTAMPSLCPLLQGMGSKGWHSYPESKPLRQGWDGTASFAWTCVWTPWMLNVVSDFTKASHAVYMMSLHTAQICIVRLGVHCGTIKNPLGAGYFYWGSAQG